jgi:excisionase family DNA binding protein
MIQTDQSIGLARPSSVGRRPPFPTRTMLHPIVWAASDTIGFGVLTCLDVPFRPRRRLYVCMTAISRPTNEPTRDPHRPLLVDVSEAAAILAISRSSIYQLIWSEQLIPIRIGRSVRFSVEQLEQFVIDRIAAS